MKKPQLIIKMNQYFFAVIHPFPNCTLLTKYEHKGLCMRIHSIRIKDDATDHLSLRYFNRFICLNGVMKRAYKKVQWKVQVSITLKHLRSS